MKPNLSHSVLLNKKQCRFTSVTSNILWEVAAPYSKRVALNTIGLLRKSMSCDQKHGCLLKLSSPQKGRFCLIFLFLTFLKMWPGFPPGGKWLWYFTFKILNIFVLQLYIKYVVLAGRHEKILNPWILLGHYLSNHPKIDGKEILRSLLMSLEIHINLQAILFWNSFETLTTVFSQFISAE